MRVRPAAQRVYKGLPAARIIESGATPSAFVASTETLAAVFTNFSKIGALASLPIGILLLISYLRFEGAPLPAADTSINILLSLMCVIFLFISLLSASIFLLPILTKISDESKSETATTSRDRSGKSLFIKRLVQVSRKYILDFGPYLSFLIFIFINVGLGQKKGVWIGSIFGLLSFAIYCWFYYKARYRKFDYVLQNNVHSVVSFVSLFFIVIEIIRVLNWDFNIWVFAAIVVVVPLVVHALVVTVVTTRRAAFAIYALMPVLLVVFLGPGYLGGLTLRSIGVGGSIPVSIGVRTYGRTGTPSGTEEVTGCLILMTAGDLLIRPTARTLDCKLHPQLMGGQSSTVIETYSRVERYTRGDVIRVSKFAEFCGTVDGLQSTSSSCNE